MRDGKPETHFVDVGDNTNVYTDEGQHIATVAVTDAGPQIDGVKRFTVDVTTFHPTGTPPPVGIRVDGQAWPRIRIWERTPDQGLAERKEGI